MQLKLKELFSNATQGPLSFEDAELVFENIMYFLCSIGLFFWLNNFVIYEEEKYLKDKFGDEFERYCNSVKRWIFF